MATIRIVILLLTASVMTSFTVLPRKIDVNKLPFFFENPRTGMHIAIFIGTDCPISQKYGHTLRELRETYPDINIYGIIPKNFTREQIRDFKNDYRIPFNFYYDSGNRVAKEFEATITPEVFLFDNQGNVYYSGAIDNWFYELGRNRKEPTELYLVNAIEQALKMETITIQKTDAVGCLIE